MNEKSDQSNKDNIIEAYYKMIGEAHIENIIADLDSNQDKIKETTVPKSLDNWFISFEKERTKKNNRQRFEKNIKKIPLKIAMILLIVTVLTTAVTFSVEAFRIRIFNFFIQKNETHTVIEKQNSLNNQSVPNIDIDEFYYLAYLPQGYYYEKYTIIDGEIVIQYSDGENAILFSQYEGSINYQLDTEDANVQEILIDGNQGHLIKKSERIILVWFNSDHNFLIKGYLPVDEVIKMAENMEKNK